MTVNTRLAVDTAAIATCVTRDALLVSMNVTMALDMSRDPRPALDNDVMWELCNQICAPCKNELQMTRQKGIRFMDE